MGSRRLLEQARRRELAQARKQIEAVDLARFSHFMQRWQHLAPSTRLAADDGTIAIARQMYGLARPAEQWEREYFPARVDDYDPAALSRLIAAGELVWVGGSAPAQPDEPSNLSTDPIRAPRLGARCGSPTETRPSRARSRAARSTRSQRDGASFFDELGRRPPVSRRARSATRCASSSAPGSSRTTRSSRCGR